MSEGNLLPITPETKVAELLDAYPSLETVLLELSPAFARLKNPILRKTVARVTTLQQASRVAGLPLGETINRLRRAAGQSEYQPSGETSNTPRPGRPSWVQAAQVAQRLDATAMLDRGEKPVSRVLNDLQKLPKGGVYELTAPFFPAPLVDLAAEKGFEHWSESGEGQVRVYFRRLGEESDLVSLGGD